MNDRVIRVGEVAGIIGVGKSTVWLWDREGKIPKSFKLTASTTVWRYSEIMAWLDEKQRESEENEKQKKSDEDEKVSSKVDHANSKVVKKKTHHRRHKDVKTDSEAK